MVPLFFGEIFVVAVNKDLHLTFSCLGAIQAESIFM